MLSLSHIAILSTRLDHTPVANGACLNTWPQHHAQHMLGFGHFFSLSTCLHWVLQLMLALSGRTPEHSLDIAADYLLIQVQDFSERVLLGTVNFLA